MNIWNDPLNGDIRRVVEENVTDYYGDDTRAKSAIAHIHSDVMALVQARLRALGVA